MQRPLSMVGFRRILLPLDVDRPTTSSLRETAAIARRFSSSVIVLCVVRPADAGRDDDDAVTRAVARAAAELERTVRAELTDVEAKCLVRVGDPAREIVRAAHDLRADLVVVRPRARIESVSAEVLVDAPCAVWSIPERPLGAIPYRLTVRAILCGVEFTPRDRLAIATAASLARELDAELTLVHASPSTRIYGPGGSYEIPERRAAVLAEARERLRDLVRDANVHASTFADTGELVDVLNEAATRCGAELVVVGQCPPFAARGSCLHVMQKAVVPVLGVDNREPLGRR